MAEQEITAIVTTVQEFVHGLQRRDPTVRRWILPEGDVDLLMDVYGEQALLSLLKGHSRRKRLVLLRASAVPGKKGRVYRAEFAWVTGEKRPPSAGERITVQLRRVRRKWLVDELWPAPLDAPLTVEQARRMADAAGGETDTATLFLAGSLRLPLEGSGDLDDVETILVLGMDAHGYSPREVVRGVRLWRDFRRQARPVYRRPAIYAAAVDYVVNLLGMYGESQGSIANYYGVSPSSLSSRFREVRDCLQLVHADARYTVLTEYEADLRSSCQRLGLPWPTPLRRSPEDEPH